MTRTVIDVPTVVMMGSDYTRGNAVDAFARSIAGALVASHPAITSCRLSSASHDAVRQELNRRGFDTEYNAAGCMGALDRL